MPTDRECVNYARECVRFAESTKDLLLRNHLLKIVRGWLATARHESDARALSVDPRRVTC